MQMDGKTIISMKPIDDKVVSGVWQGDKEEGRALILETQNNTEWRVLNSDRTNDRNLIRYAISALNFKLKEDKSVRQLIEEARPFWEKCKDEVIPTPIPIDNTKSK